MTHYFGSRYLDSDHAYTIANSTGASMSTQSNFRSSGLDLYHMINLALGATRHSLLRLGNLESICNNQDTACVMMARLHQSTVWKPSTFFSLPPRICGNAVKKVPQRAFVSTRATNVLLKTRPALGSIALLTRPKYPSSSLRYTSPHN